VLCEALDFERREAAFGERMASRPVNACIHPAGRPIHTS
jgi:hypothetical protein